MASKKKPATLAVRVRRLSEGSRFYVDREVIEELADVKVGLEEFTGADAGDAISTLRTSLESLNDPAALGLGVSEQNLAAMLDLLDQLEQLLPDADVMSTLSDRIEAAEELVAEVENQRDDPSSYDADERGDTRDNARTALEELADALDDASVEDAQQPDGDPDGRGYHLENNDGGTGNAATAALVAEQEEGAGYTFAEGAARRRAKKRPSTTEDSL
jgi:hypothetical protein